MASSHRPVPSTTDKSAGEGGPLNNLYPRDPERPRIRTPVPLPLNVRHLYPPSTHQPANNGPAVAPMANPSTPSYVKPYGTSHTFNNTKMTPSSFSTNNGTFGRYVAFPGGMGKEEPYSGKRRKLSTATTAAPTFPSQPIYNTQPQSFHNTSTASSAQPPNTVPSLNGAATPLVNNAATYHARTHPLGKTPHPSHHFTDGDSSRMTDFGFRTSPMKSGRNGSFQAQSQPQNAPTRPATTSTPAVHTPGPVLSIALSEEENHFLIYLKEVKKLRWGDITDVFNQYYPGRTYPKLQSTYSQKLNKRDRSKDPPTWKVPPSFDPEAIPQSASPAAPIIPKQPKHRPPPAWQEPFASVETSHATEPRRERPQRAVPRKDYTWGRLQDLQFNEEEEKDSVAEKSTEPPESLKSAPEVAIPIDNAPLVPYSFEKEDALLAVSAHKQQARPSNEKLPYLSFLERFTMQNPPPDQEWDQVSSRDWQGSLVHVDFNRTELKVVQKAIYKVLGTPKEDQKRHDRKHLRRLLRDLPEPKFLRIQSEAYKQLQNRDRKSVKAFLADAQCGQFRTQRPVIERLAAARPNREYSSAPKASITSMVSDRELGLQSRRGWKAASQPLSYQMKNKMHDSLGPSFRYTGASSDVHTVAWSPDCQCFVAGAICVDDPDSMQYNKGNNLLYGDLTYGVIHELGGHSVPRPRTKSGPNSTHAMFASQDPKLYKTVSSVVFSPDGRFVYSGGYDRKVCIWETRPGGDTLNVGQPKWLGAWRHKAPVDIMAINSSGLLATASKKPSTNAIKTIRMIDNDCQMIERENFSSRKATSKPNLNILPTALQFSPRYENLLLAGFGANVRVDKLDVSGDMCLWDVNRPKEPLNIIGSGKNVFDLAFHPRQNWFAAACVAGSNVNRGMQSVVRLHDEVDSSKYSMLVELECRALDMNDIAWCPGNDYLIAAGCTSGRVYVWDVRMPDDFLRELAHARSLMPLDDRLEREITDTGVRFLSWGDNATRLYTGSSDGVVKVWNVAASEDETFVKDLITTESGIMSGAFSPDKSKLVLGDINGSISVLEVGQEDRTLKEVEKFMFVPYDGTAEREDEMGEVEQQSILGQSSEDSGVVAANELLQSGQMLQMPLGGLPIRQAVQGPNYAGPFDYSVDAPFLREQALQFQLDLAKPAGPQCALPACKDAIVRVTSEEIGDSGRSLDRIADELRQAWKTPRSTLMKSIPGKSRCQNCDGIARPSISGETYCERCSFACFRCCQRINVPPATDKLMCPHCSGVWEIGALGFESVRETHERPNLDGIVPSLGNLTIDDGSSEETDDYYFRQVMDRPESPPL